MTERHDHSQPGEKKAGRIGIIIDSLPGVRHLDNMRSSPASLQAVNVGRTVLDWVLNAISENGIRQITYVGGYHIQKVIERYPSLQYRFHSNWRNEGELRGILLARPETPSDVLIVRAGLICVPEAVQRVSNDIDEITAACYGETTDTSFAGLLAVSADRCDAFFDQIAELSAHQPDADIPTVIDAVRSCMQPVQSVRVDGLAAPVDDRAAVSATVFGGKGRTLEQIRPLIKKATVLDQVRFCAVQWKKNPGPVLATIQKELPHSQLVVRSNTHAEDGLEESGAGAFHSVLGVPLGDTQKLLGAVEEVINSYTSRGRDIHDLDEVLVQPQVFNLTSSGVLLTRDMETGAPYYVINIDRCSGRSDTVTSGAEASVDTHFVHRNADRATLPDDVRRCVEIAQELEELTQVDALDIEFGFDVAGEAFLFQVRPIASKAKRFELADDDLFDEVNNIRQFLTAHFAPHPVMSGRRTLFGSMPDWNPAEMIGTVPHPLALSLYQQLIGADAWAAARAAIGYRDCRPELLIISLAGRPYVDVRASLNSFLPAQLNADVSERWVNHGLDLLERNPELHDKIEFEVAVTCLTFDFDRDSQRMRDAGLSDSEINDFREHLLKLTDNTLLGNLASIDTQVAELRTLDDKRRQRLRDVRSSRTDLARRVNALLRDCERHGTGPFSVLARYGFIAVSFLRSLQNYGIFSQDEYASILSAIPTVASDLSRDLARFSAGEISDSQFIDLYGHLRPSSYDVTSPNYASALSAYVSHSDGPCKEPEYPDISVAREIFDGKSAAIGRLLSDHGFAATAVQLRDFVLRSIPGREWAKFEFTKSLNAALETVARYGQSLGFSREDVSYLPIQAVCSGATGSESGACRTQLRRTIEFHKKQWHLTSAIRLPHLICKLDEIDSFRLEQWQPNFITTQRVAGEPVFLDRCETPAALDGRIVVIRAADPGYDWIFGHDIIGLITQYGGVASHMAIRAAEFGLPAAIGCGDVIFQRLEQAWWIELDCATKTIRGSNENRGIDASDEQHRLLRAA